MITYVRTYVSVYLVHFVVTELKEDTEDRSFEAKLLSSKSYKQIISFTKLVTVRMSRL